MSIREWLGVPAREGERVGISGWLVVIAAIYLVIGVAAFAAYSITGNSAWVESFFKIPGALLAFFFALIQLWFAIQVLSHFSGDEPMRNVWLCLAGSAGFDLVGATCSQVLGIDSPLNPLTYTPMWSPQTATEVRQYGLLLGGTCRFTLLAVGLALSVRIYRRHRLLGRFTWLDWLILILMGSFTAKEIVEIVQAGSAGRNFFVKEIASWPVDTLLWFSLFQALLLYRSAHQMGPGWVTRCWNAFAVGTFLICVGVVADWATRWDYFPWPWSALIWYIWLPAGAAFALAPVYQLEAIQNAIAAHRGVSRA